VLFFAIIATGMAAYYLLAPPGKAGLETKPITAAPGESRKLIIGLPGIFCPACEESIETTLRKTDGIISVDADFNSRRAVVVYDPTKITKEQIIEIIKQLGYRITGISEVA